MPYVSRLCVVWLAMTLPARAAGLEPLPVAPGVYAFVGTGGVPQAANRGRVANSGFIVGSAGVVVIDTGISQRFGAEMLASIRSVTQRPVRLVILTHATQEFVFGASPFAEAGAVIAAHRETIKLMASRCGHCLDSLRPLLGAELDGTRLILPTRPFEGSETVSEGGMSIEVLHLGWASTPGDVVVYHPASGVAFTGGMALYREVPPIRDCDFAGWLAALHELKKLPIRKVVPGFGPVGGPEVIDSTLTYLHTLDRRLRTLYAESSSLLQALDRGELDRFRSWSGYEARHRQNVQHRYLQLEIEDLGGDPRSTLQP